MDKLKAIQNFVRVADELSITAAAAKLDLTASAVAKSLSRLEDNLGVKLLTRTTRRISLTDFGQEYYEHCIRILADLQEAENSLQRAQQLPQGHLRIMTPVSFSRITLIPRLDDFFKRYPDVTLDLHVGDEPVDVIGEKFDLVVRSGHLEDSGLISRLLTRGPRITCASPAYLKKYGIPEKPDDLSRHNCIVSTFGAAWPFRVNGSVQNITVHGNLQVRNGDASREAALHGLGIAQSNWWTYRHDLANGALVPLLEDYQVEGTPVSILFPASKYMPPKLREFINFLVEITHAPRTMEH